MSNASICPVCGEGPGEGDCLSVKHPLLRTTPDLGPPDPLPKPTPPRCTDRPEITVDVDARPAEPKEPPTP